MDFAALRSSSRGESDYRQDSAAEIVRKANSSALVDNLSGCVAKAACNAAASVVALMRNASNRAENEQREEEESEQRNLWHVFNAGLLEVQANLVRNGIRSQLFQDQLLLALHREDFGHPETRAGAGDNQRRPARTGLHERRGERQAVPLALYWRLHESGLLPLSRLLEATEAVLSPLTGGQECGIEDERRLFGGSLDAIVHDIVHDMRSLAVQSAREDAESNEGDAAHVLSGVAKHLFDLVYRKVPVDSERPTAASRAARTVLDKLCCGPQVFGADVDHGTCRQDQGTEARLRGCLSVVSAILPMAASVVSSESDSAAAFISARSTVRDDGAFNTGMSPNGYDGPTATFLSHQLRLLMESSSGQSEHTQGKGVAGPADGIDGHPELLADILRYFPSADVIEVLRSICRRAAVRAADRSGFSLHKPLLRWDTLGPIVRAASTAHPQDVPSAVALTGTEMAAAAVNFIPSGDGNTSRTKNYNQQQGVLVLSAALRLVAEADVCSRQIQSGGVEGEGGLYASWARSCFGTDDRRTNVVGSADDGHPQQGHGQGTQMRDLQPRPSGSELQPGMRGAMEKQRATEILMEALCLSVPYDPDFVLEVHRDVLKTRLRAKFSVQVRDLVDLVATRLSDLKTRDEAYRPRGVAEGHHSHCASEVENHSDRQSGGCSDPITREVGFFLRQFKQTGVVPLALKTAILWQPKAWASFRKVLLAPPAERIALPDDSGNTRPESGLVVKEAIGRGENGLRVEVSLKYRRLLVQKLAKESLLSAKDHEAFRKSYVEYLQDQRDEDGAERHVEDEPEAVTAVARRLLMLESKLGQIDKANGPSTVERRIALLLQEYIPRALAVELCMEDDGEAQCRSQPPAYLRHGRDWFSRASSLLQQILGEWKQCFRPREDVPGCSASPEQMAEAVLNSVHCCVAAVAASLLSPCQSCPVSSAISSSDSYRRRIGGDDTEGKEVAHPEANSSAKKMLTLLDLPVARALQRVGQVVTLTAEMDFLGEALFRRCSNLLANPTNLDPKQILSLAHSLAALSSAFHGKVTTFLNSLVEDILSWQSSSHEGGRSKSPTEQMAGLAGTAQIGALYLQSSLLLQEHIWEKAVECSVDGSRAGTEGDAEGDSHCRDTRNRIGIESVGLAPVIMLEFCWWMERRLSLAQHTMTAERRNGGMTGLLQLLGKVLKHPLIERALSSVFCARGSTVPSLERLVSFEMAISSENAFGGASVKLLVLESITLDRVAVVPTGSAEGRRCKSNSDQAASAQPLNRSAASSVSEVWKECTACLFGNASLRDAALRRVRRGATPSDGCTAGVKKIVGDWESQFHPAWRDADASGRLTHGSAEGVDGLLDSIVQIMGKLCNLEAAAGSACEKGSGNDNFAEARDPCELGTEGQRRASVLLAESLTLLTRSRIDGSGPALVLIAEITVMAIGATEGRRKAIESLRLLWEGWFCKMRPLEVGAIERLMRIAILWHGGRSDEKHGGSNRVDDPMTRTLENLPVLGAEMARTWTRLGRTLQPMIGSHRTSAGLFVREGWASQLDCLHSAGTKILLCLAQGGVSAEDTPSSSTRPGTNKSDRIPLGTVKNSIPDQKGSIYAQHRDQGCAAKDAQNGKALRDRRREESSLRPCHEPFRDALAALPHTSAQVVIGVLQAVAEMRAKGSQEVATPERDAKRVKAMTGEPRKLEGPASTEILEGKLPEGIGWCNEASSRAWAARVLESMFGSNPAGPAASSLRVLLETVVLETGYRRTPIGIGNAGSADKVCAEVCKSLGVSLAVAILGHSPPLVAGMAEPPCLADSSSSISPIERLERSLAVLDVLKMFFAVRPGLNEPKGWIVVLLSHYIATLLILANEHLTGTLLNRRGWPDVVAFVHARVRGVARTDLQKLPVALRLAAQEVDPLLKQYF